VRVPTTLAICFLIAVLAGPALAEEEEGESSLSVNGYVKLQTGVFVPMLSDLYSAKKNEAWILDANDRRIETCNPVEIPYKPCFPSSHGVDPGSLSMFRATLQLEGDWTPHEDLAVHAIFRGVRSLMNDQDGWAQLPVAAPDDMGLRERRARARQWVLDNYYNEFELREFYVDVFPTEWLSFRLGRQQVTWGETGQYRLLDVINPSDTTWHFGPLESFEDTRIPLWIVKGLVEFPSIDHSLEVVWVPGLDRPEDMVTVPLTFVGAWGLPYPNTPSPFIIDEKIFMYPENSIEDTMRVGFRWKGNLTPSMTYSLVYYYTHQLSPPIPLYYDRVELVSPTGDISYSSRHLERLYLGFPRQHIAGFTFDFTLENPIGAVVKLEAAIEPDRMYPRTSTTGQTHQDEYIDARVHFEQPRHMAISYALVVMRPTMIRFLNPTQNFMLVFQFHHTIVPGLSDAEKIDLVEIPGFNDFKVKVHGMKFIFAAFTNYLHGLLTPKIVIVWIPPDPDRIGRKETDETRLSSGEFFTKSSAFISASLALRLGDHWRAVLTLTDFFGAAPYGGVGLFADRDEINLSILCQF
jgi:hypothetical protein